MPPKRKPSGYQSDSDSIIDHASTRASKKRSSPAENTRASNPSQTSRPQRKGRPAKAPLPEDPGAGTASENMSRRQDASKPTKDTPVKEAAKPSPQPVKYVFAKLWDDPKIKTTGDDFPIFNHDGSIIILLGEKKDQVFRLHSNQLGRNAPFFKEDRTEVVEFNPEAVNRYFQGAANAKSMRKYEMVKRDDAEGYTLVRVPFTKPLPVKPPAPEPAPAPIVEVASGHPDPMEGVAFQQDPNASIFGDGKMSAGQPNTALQSQLAQIKSEPGVVIKVENGAGFGMGLAMSPDMAFGVAPMLSTGIAPEMSPPGMAPGNAPNMFSAMSPGMAHGMTAAQTPGLALGNTPVKTPGMAAHTTHGPHRIMTPALVPGAAQGFFQSMVHNVSETMGQGPGPDFAPANAPGTYGRPSTPPPMERGFLQGQAQQQEAFQASAPGVFTGSPKKPFHSGRGPMSREDYIHGFTSLFRIFYGLQPLISDKDLHTALEQAEALVICCMELGTDLARIGPHIGSAFNEFGQDVYKAIVDEPYRWIKLACRIKHVIYFKEAIVHIVGRFPDHRDERELFAGLDREVYKLIMDKARHLHNMLQEVSVILLTAGIEEDGARVNPDPSNRVTFDTFFMHQYWRAWLAEQFHNARRVCVAPDAPYVPANNTDSIVKMGMLIRLLGKGGDAYLPIGDAQHLMNNFIVKNNDFCRWSNVGYDLTIFKEYALGHVKHLIKNESMLGPDVVEFKHLTCTAVSKEELPWYSPEDDTER